MSNNEKIIVVLGATGNQGSSIVRRFLRLPGWHVRGITRDVTTKTSTSLTSEGAEMISANLDEPETLVKAFRGANVIYGFTDFWILTQHPDLPNLLNTKYKGLSIGQACFEHELQHGRNISSAVEQVLLEENKLEHFIFSTASSVSKQSRGKLENVLHFDVKSAIEGHLAKEHPKVAQITSYLAPGFFMANIANFPFLQPKKEENGNYVFSWPCVSTETSLPLIDPARDTGFFVEALLKLPIGTRLLGASETVKIQQIVDAWAQATNTRARFVPMSKEQGIEGLERLMPGFGLEFAENMQYYAEFGYTGGDQRIKSPENLGINTAALSSYGTFIQEYDWSSVLSA